MATIKDVAKEANVSVATVSRVINNDTKVSDVTRKHVLQIINKTGYVPNMLGRNLRISKTKKILILIPTLANNIYGTVIDNIERTAEKYGYTVFVAITNSNRDTEEKYIDLLKNRSIDGIISAGTSLSASEISTVSDNFPFVMCCEDVDDVNINVVKINDRNAVYDSIKYLINKGHNKIAIITSKSSYSGRARTKGYLDALKDNNIEINSSYIVHTGYEKSNGYDACKKLMQLDNPPTAIFCICDNLLLGCVKALKELNINLDLIDLFGVDDTLIMDMLPKFYPRIRQPYTEIGEKSLELIFENICNKNMSPKHIILNHQIVT